MPPKLGPKAKSGQQGPKQPSNPKETTSAVGKSSAGAKPTPVEQKSKSQGPDQGIEEPTEPSIAGETKPYTYEDTLPRLRFRKFVPTISYNGLCPRSFTDFNHSNIVAELQRDLQEQNATDSASKLKGIEDLRRVIIEHAVDQALQLQDHDLPLPEFPIPAQELAKYIGESDEQGIYRRLDSKYSDHRFAAKRKKMQSETVDDEELWRRANEKLKTDYHECEFVTHLNVICDICEPFQLGC